MNEVEIGSKWINHKGVYGVIEEIGGVKMMVIKMNGKNIKTLVIQKLKRDEWSKI